MKKSLTYVFLLLIIGKVTLGQTHSILQKVNIGDALPNYLLKNIMNYPKGWAYLSDFKGKVLILDFWESSCKSCIESWPKLMKLQEKFKDKIQIITINAREDQKRITELIKQQERIYKYTMILPVVYGDSDIKQLFPYNSLPHIVFVDQNQIVKYVAAGWELNENTIQSVLDQREIKIGEKTDLYMDRYRPLYSLGNIGKYDQGQNVVFSTVITPYSSDADGIGTIESYPDKSYGYFGNHSLKSLLRIVFGRGPSLLSAVPDSRVLFKDLDSTKYVTKIDGIRQIQNGYTIQIIAKKYFSMEQIKWKIYNELAAYFDIKAYWSKQKKICLVISKSKFPIKEYQEGETTWRRYMIGATSFRINKVSMQNLVDMMSLQSGQLEIVGIPVVDETNFNGLLGNIEFESANRKITYQLLGDVLNKNGLQFSLQEREVDVLVITKADAFPALTSKF